MLFKAKTLTGIAEGTVELAFRRWKRPTVVSGGSLVTSVGVLEIVSVTPIAVGSISAADAERAGYQSRQALLNELAAREGELYRIEFKLAGPDPRICLREDDKLDESERGKIEARLARLAKTWPVSPIRLLQQIAGQPEGTRAADLAAGVGMEREQFKLKVRVLKNMGLTESLGTGYRLSPRGRAFLAG